MESLFDLKGKVAIITGGMGQLGLEYSVALAQRGVKVVIFDLLSEPSINTQAFSRFIRDGSIKAFVVDITMRKELVTASKEVLKMWGCPHILINNAAIDSPPNAPACEVGYFEDYPEASFDRVMEVNVKGTFLCCQIIGGLMAAIGRGSILNISSTYGILSPCQDIYRFRWDEGEVFFKPVAYSTSKSAILNLTRYLATYWAKKGVRVNTLTLAGVYNNQSEEFLSSYCSRVPMGRMAYPREMVGAIIFLSSEASSYMTGSNLIIDGGWSAW
jgi:NAD(P)-dependent dehydrogenase (short-subunit alcohol dehydrogenase family)